MVRDREGRGMGEGRERDGRGRGEGRKSTRDGEHIYGTHRPE